MTAIPPSLNSTDWVSKYEAGEFTVSQEELMAELQLAVLGDVIPLSIKIDTNQFSQEIEQFKNDWTDYLPRADRSNNRKGLTLTSYPGMHHSETPSLPEIRRRFGSHIIETDICEPTEVYRKCESLHPILNLFPSLGRSFLIQSNMGGYFVPHRDHPQLNRDVFRVIAFIKNCKRYEFDFLFENQCLEIEEGRAYVVNTRKCHRTMSFVDDSIQMVLNVPLNLRNVLTILSNLQHRH